MLFFAGLVFEVIPLVLLIFYADKITDKLKLSEKFETEEFDLGGIDTSGIVKIGCFIVGAYLIVSSASDLLYQLFSLFKQEVGARYDIYDEDRYVHTPTIVVETLNIIIGYLLITNYDRVAKFLNKPKKADVEL